MHVRRHRLPLALAFSALLVGAGAVSAAPAQAAASSCPSGKFCFWVDGPFLGPMGTLAGSNPAWSVFPQARCADRGNGAAANWDDCASSLYNRRGRTVVVYIDPNYNYGSHAGIRLALGNGAQYGVMPMIDQYTSWNDRISSNEVL